MLFFLHPALTTAVLIDARPYQVVLQAHPQFVDVLLLAGRNNRFINGTDGKRIAGISNGFTFHQVRPDIGQGFALPALDAADPLISTPAGGSTPPMICIPAFARAVNNASLPAPG